MFLQHKGTINVPKNKELNENLVTSPLNVDVSIYKSYRDNIGLKCNLLAFLTTNKYHAQTTAIRNEQGKKKRDKLKSNLPAVTVSGKFDVRNLQSKYEPTNLICLDFDGVPNLDGLFNHLKTLPYIAFAGYSVSGLGVYAIVPIQNTSTFLGHFYALERDFLAFGYPIDPSCKDVTRLRGASYTANPYINHQASTYTDTAPEPQKAPPPTATAVRPAAAPSTANTPTDKAVQIATDAATKKGLYFDKGSRASYTVFVAGLLNRFGIDMFEAFNALDSAIGIAQHPDHKKRFFDVYKRYINEFGTAKFLPTYEHASSSTTASSSKAQKKVFAPLKTDPLRTIKYDKYLSDSPEFEAMCCLMLLSDRQKWTFEAPPRAGKTHAFTRDFCSNLERLHPNKIVLFLNPLRSTSNQVTAANTELNTDTEIFKHSCFTWDKGLLFLKKHIDRLNDIVLVVDESHDLIKAASPQYKATQIGILSTYMPYCFKVIGLSGTTFGIMGRLNYTTIAATPTTIHPHKAELITTEPENIPSEIINLLKTTDGKGLVFCSSATSTSQTSAESLATLSTKFGLTSDFIFSGNKASNPTSQHLQSKGTIPEHLKAVFCTAVFETGLTVDVDFVIFINDRPQNDFAGIWQSLSRNTTDKVRRVFVVTEPIPEPMHPQYDFNFWQVQKEITEHQKLADVYTAHHHILKQSESLKNYQLPNPTDTTNGAIIWSEPEQKYVVCSFVLLNRQYPKITKSYTDTDIKTFLEQYTQTDVIHRDRTNKPANEAISTTSKEISTASKEQKTIDKATVTELLSTPEQVQMFLSGVATYTENTSLKQQLIYKAGAIINPNTPTEISELHHRNTKICETAASRYAYLNTKFLGCINGENLSVWSVESSYNYGVIQQRLAYTVNRLLINIYSEAKLQSILNDDKAPQKIDTTRKKMECFFAIQTAQQTAQQAAKPQRLTVTDVLNIVRQFEPKVKKDGLNSYLNTFCEATSTRYNKVRYLTIKPLNYDALLDTNLYLERFNDL